MAKTQTVLQEGERNIAPPLRTYQLTEQKYRDIRSSAWALLIVGSILLYTSLGDTPEILCLKRLDMIRILITREYSGSFDEEFLDQLCEDIYNMLFEENLM